MRPCRCRWNQRGKLHLHGQNGRKTIKTGVLFFNSWCRECRARSIISIFFGLRSRWRVVSSFRWFCRWCWSWASSCPPVLIGRFRFFIHCSKSLCFSPKPKTTALWSHWTSTLTWWWIRCPVSPGTVRDWCVRFLPSSPFWSGSAAASERGIDTCLQGW